MTEWTEQLSNFIRSACRLEVLASKPGNVCPEHSFADATIDDFLASADVVAPVLAQSAELGVGTAILRAVELTVKEVGHNTNLGIVLLLAPLAAVPRQECLSTGIHTVLNDLTVDDAIQTYRAIAVAAPGGLGAADAQDVSQRPDLNLRQCMRLAAERDLIAAQYANGFRDVLEHGVWSLYHTRPWEDCVDSRLAWLALNMMATRGDSLIRRKCGDQTSQDVQRRALAVLQTGWPQSDTGEMLYNEFDAFLRDTHHRRNPGTTADMIAAVLFAALRSGLCRCQNDQLVFVESANVQSL